MTTHSFLCSLFFLLVLPFNVFSDDREQGTNLRVLLSDGSVHLLSKEECRHAKYFRQRIDYLHDCKLADLEINNVEIQRFIIESLRHVAVLVHCDTSSLPRTLAKFIKHKIQPCETEAYEYVHFRFLLQLFLESEKLLFVALETACLHVIIEKFSPEQISFFLRGLRISDYMRAKLHRLYKAINSVELPLVKRPCDEYYAATLEELVADGGIPVPPDYNPGAVKGDEGYGKPEHWMVNDQQGIFHEIPCGEFRSDALKCCAAIVQEKIEQGLMNHWLREVKDRDLLREVFKETVHYAEKFVKENSAYCVMSELGKQETGVAHTALCFAYYKRYRNLSNQEKERIAGPNLITLVEPVFKEFEASIQRCKSRGVFSFGKIFAHISGFPLNRRESIAEELILLAQGFCESSIKRLSFAHCNLSHIPDSVVIFSDIEELTLSNNTSMSFLPGYLGAFRRLKRLRVNNCDIQNLRTFNLPYLEVLSIGNNSFLANFDGGNMPLLKTILCGNSQVVLFGGLKKFKNLRTLDLTGIKTGRFAGLSSLKQLRYLEKVSLLETDVLARKEFEGAGLADKLSFKASRRG